MAEYDSVTNIVTHHTLAKPQRSKTPLPNHPSFHNKFLIYIFFQIDDSRPLFSLGDSIARFDRPNWFCDSRFVLTKRQFANNPDDSKDFIRTYLITILFIMFNWFILHFKFSFHVFNFLPMIPQGISNKM
jgi:hypothetical protein